MGTLCPLAIVLAVSASLEGSERYQWNSGPSYKQLAEICDPQAVGAAQLYCTYCMMGLLDGLIAGARSMNCLPESTSVQALRRMVYEQIAGGAGSRRAAISGVSAALKAAHPCP